MKIAFFSNAPWIGTGYGTQTAQVCSRMKADGHDVAILANYGLAGAITTWEGIPVYPQGADPWSNDVIVAHTMDWGRGDPVVLVTLFDVWPLRNEHFDQLPVIASWVPVDHVPTPPQVAAWCSRPNVVPIAMAEFGQRALAESGVDALHAPLAIDTKATFTLDADGSAFRAQHRIPDDAHLTVINAANKANGAWHRKAWAEMFMALGEHMAVHRNAWVYIHTLTDRSHGGWDIDRLITRFGLPKDRVRIVDQYKYRVGLPAEHVAAAYAAGDVLLSTSMSEGFGLAVVEAQACGTPVIVTDCTAQPELVGDGWLVSAQPWWDEALDACVFTPSVPGIIAALAESHARPRGRSAKARLFAERYDADVVYEAAWRPVLAQLEERLTDLEPVP